MMKAWVLNSAAPIDSRPLELTEVETPEAGDGQLLIRVRACGICRTDLHVVEGDLPVRRPRVIPGHQIVGEVAARGNDVEGFVAGHASAWPG